MKIRKILMKLYNLFSEVMVGPLQVGREVTSVPFSFSKMIAQYGFLQKSLSQTISCLSLIYYISNHQEKLIPAGNKLQAEIIFKGINI